MTTGLGRRYGREIPDFLPLMKTLFLAVVLLVSLTTLSPANAPALSAAKAATIAQEDLASRGLDATVYIVEVNYKKE